MNKYVVVGNPIAHSKSPLIYNYLFRKFGIDAYYSRLLINDESELHHLIKELNLSGLNITSPFKSKVHHTLDKSVYDSELKDNLKFNLVNTVKIEKGKFHFYNTDYEFLQERLETLNNRFNRALITGSGASAKIIASLMNKLNISYDISLRNPNEKKRSEFHGSGKFLDIENIENDIINYDLIFNTVENIDDYFSERISLESSTIIDAIYHNPYFKDITNSENYISGVEWLIGQAVKSFQYFTGLENIPKPDTEILTQSPNNRNIYLIGFMGAGKSHIGKLLAGKLKYKFLDIDKLIEKKAGKSINEIFDCDGEEKFREIESIVLDETKKSEKCVISTGGGIIKNQKNVDIMRSSGFVIWIYSNAGASYARINNKTRPLADNLDNFTQLINDRLDKYFSSSDLIVINDKQLSVTLENIYMEVIRIL